MQNKIPPRKVPGQDEFYLGMAFWAASRSKDPNTQCGAVIVSADRKPLGWGFNGPPKQIDDNEINWARPDKYPWIIHAEINAIKHSCGDLHGSTIYVTGHPCKNCMLEIVAEGIKRVVWFRVITDGHSLVDPDPMSIEIAERGGISIEEFNGNLNWMQDRMQFFKTIGAIQ